MNSSVLLLFTSILLMFSLSSQTQITSFGAPFRNVNQSVNNFESAYNVQVVSGMSLDKRVLLGGSVISSSQVNLVCSSFWRCVKHWWSRR